MSQVNDTPNQRPVDGVRSRAMAHLAQIREQAQQLGHSYENGLTDWIMWGSWNNNSDKPK